MMKLYGGLGSGSCAVELTLAELGLDYQVLNVDLRSGQQRETGYSEINPQRKLPALVDSEGFVLTESAAILISLCEQHGEANLLPPVGAKPRAQALRWLLFVATELYPLVEINDYPERFTPAHSMLRGRQNADAIRDIARQLWRQRWLIVERQINAGPYLLGDVVCVTDFYIAVVSQWAQQDNWRPGNLPNVERLTATVANRSLCAPIWEQHFA